MQTSSERRVRELEGRFAEPGKPGVGVKLGGRQPVLDNIWGMLSHPLPCGKSNSANERTGFTVPGQGRQRLLYRSPVSVLCCPLPRNQQ